MTKVYLHVGLPKTGTTFLQERCFPNLKDVHLVNQQLRVPATGLLQRIWDTVEKYPLFVDLDERRAEVERFLHGVTEEKLLISYERLTGDMSWGLRDHAQATTILAEFFPAARVILTVRRQDDLLESIYRERLRAFYHPTVDGFLNYNGHAFEDRFLPLPAFPSVNVWRFDYHVYARNYAAMFGRENVLVLPLELLAADPQRYHATVADFLGCEPFIPPDGRAVNRGYSQLTCRLALLLNRFVRAPWQEKRAMRFIPHEAARYVLEHVVNRVPSPRTNLISDEQRRKILEIHRESNRRLDEDHGLDLRGYGYY